MKRLSFFIARRYLFSRKKTVINIISWISLIGISVGTLALIVVLSVYNGIGELTKSLFNSFDPELIVEPLEGKTFRTSAIPYKEVKAMEGVRGVSEIVEENAWITYRDNESIVQLRGVDEQYSEVSGLDTMLMNNQYVLQEDGCYFIILGGDIYYNLGLSSMSSQPIAVHIPKRGTGISLSMEGNFNTQYAYPADLFYILQDIDQKYVVGDIEMMRKLMDYKDDEVTALAISVKNPQKLNKVKKELRELLKGSCSVKDRFEQQPLYYKIFRSEKFGIYLILSLIVLIATLNLVSSLSLLIIDKQRNIRTLRSMGMEDVQIREVFFMEGVLIAGIGAFMGLVMGFFICFLQQEFGIVKMGDGNFVTPVFPVAMKAMDFISTFVLVVTLSIGSVFFATRRVKLQ